MNFYKTILLPLFSIISCFVFAQNKTEYNAQLPAIHENGFYKILITPEITAGANRLLQDIRLVDDENNEVAYIFRKEAPLKKEKLFVEYKIITKEHNRRKGYTRLVIHNPEKTEINSISLIIKNSDVSKWLTLNASDDNNRWYVLKDRYYFRSFFTETETSEIKVLNFPISNYKYYELLIYDYFDKPINIQAAGFYDTQYESGIYTELPSPTIIQNDTIENKIGLIKILFDKPYLIDKMEFTAEGNKFYYRNSCLGFEDSIVRKNGIEKTFECQNSFFLNSSSSNQIVLKESKRKEYILKIDNKDDKPLSIDSIKAWQLTNFIVAELEKGKKYHLKYGNPEAKAPVYDLQYFKDSIPKNLTVLKPSKAVVKTTIVEKKAIISLDSIWMWAVLIVIIGILGYFSFKMLREMKGE